MKTSNSKNKITEQQKYTLKESIISQAKNQSDELNLPCPLCSKNLLKIFDFDNKSKLILFKCDCNNKSIQKYNLNNYYNFLIHGKIKCDECDKNFSNNTCEKCGANFCNTCFPPHKNNCKNSENQHNEMNLNFENYLPFFEGKTKFKSCDEFENFLSEENFKFCSFLNDIIEKIDIIINEFIKTKNKFLNLKNNYKIDHNNNFINNNIDIQKISNFNLLFNSFENINSKNLLSAKKFEVSSLLISEDFFVSNKVIVSIFNEIGNLNKIYKSIVNRKILKADENQFNYDDCGTNLESFISALATTNSNHIELKEENNNMNIENQIKKTFTFSDNNNIYLNNKINNKNHAKNNVIKNKTNKNSKDNGDFDSPSGKKMCSKKRNLKLDFQISDASDIFIKNSIKKGNNEKQKETFNHNNAIVKKKSNDYFNFDKTLTNKLLEHAQPFFDVYDEYLLGNFFPYKTEKPKESFKLKSVKENKLYQKNKLIIREKKNVN